MTTYTRSMTNTTTITFTDVRELMAQIQIEMRTICEATVHLVREFDLEDAMMDISILALNDVITTLHLQLYVDDEIVRQYSYLIADEVLEPFGPDAANPPLGFVPPGARVRLVVTRNTKRPAEHVGFWLSKLGWGPAKPLSFPDNLRQRTYGSFVSGGYGIERQLLENPKYDAPLETADSGYLQKELAQ